MVLQLPKVQISIENNSCMQPLGCTVTDELILYHKHLYNRTAGYYSYAFLTVVRAL